MIRLIVLVANVVLFNRKEKFNYNEEQKILTVLKFYGVTFTMIKKFE